MKNCKRTKGLHFKIAIIFILEKIETIKILQQALNVDLYFYIFKVHVIMISSNFHVTIDFSHNLTFKRVLVCLP